MFRSLFRIFSLPTSPLQISPSETLEQTNRQESPPESLRQPGFSRRKGASSPGDHGGNQVVAPGNHRERVLSMSVAHSRLCSVQRCERLASFGIETIGDLARCHPEQVATHFTAKKKAARVITQYRRAVRLSASVPGLLPRDAMLLVSIHRRSVRGLAMESPGQLQRDLERFAESSRGRHQLRGRRLPSLRRIKRWIAESEAARRPSMHSASVHSVSLHSVSVHSARVA